jgi:hypothetical protein
MNSEIFKLNKKSTATIAVDFSNDAIQILTVTANQSAH